MLLAVDPSVRSPGIAVFADGVLACAGRLSVKRVQSEDGAHWLDTAKQIVNWAQRAAHADGFLTLVYEKPQIYTAFKSKGDPNDLIGLAGVGSAIAGILSLVRGFTVSSPTPAEWIGQLPKSTKGSAKESPRANRILSRLSPVELALVPDQHDAIDAVGLGLWALGRLEPRRTFSNGR